MSQIKGKNKRPEMLVRRLLFGQGYRYKLHDKTLLSNPDQVLPKYRTVIFVHGCFWRGHEGCEYYTTPKTLTQSWTDKINRNKGNDVKALEALLNTSGKVIEIWECQLGLEKLALTLNNLPRKLQ